MLGRSCRPERPGRSWESGTCSWFAMMQPRPVRERLNGDHLGPSPMRSANRRVRHMGFGSGFTGEMELTNHAKIAIDGCYPLVPSRFQKFAGDNLLHGQDDSISTPDADCCTSILYRFGCIFHLVVDVNSCHGICGSGLRRSGSRTYLEIPTIWRKGGIRKVVACPNGCLRSLPDEQPCNSRPSTLTIWIRAVPGSLFKRQVTERSAKYFIEGVARCDGLPQLCRV